MKLLLALLWTAFTVDAKRRELIGQTFEIKGSNLSTEKERFDNYDAYIR